MGCASLQGSTSRGPYFGALSGGLREISFLKYIRRIRGFRDGQTFISLSVWAPSPRASSYHIDFLSNVVIIVSVGRTQKAWEESHKEYIKNI